MFSDSSDKNGAVLHIARPHIIWYTVISEKSSWRWLHKNAAQRMHTVSHKHTDTDNVFDIIFY